MGHTIPKIYPGGLNGALFKEKYQLSIAALDKEPAINVTKVRAGRINLFNSLKKASKRT